MKTFLQTAIKHVKVQKNYRYNKLYETVMRNEELLWTIFLSWLLSRERYLLFYQTAIELWLPTVVWSAHTEKSLPFLACKIIHFKKVITKTSNEFDEEKRISLSF